MFGVTLFYGMVRKPKGQVLLRYRWLPGTGTPFKIIPVLQTRIRNRRIHIFLGPPDPHPHPDPLVTSKDPDLDPAPDPSLF